MDEGLEERRPGGEGEHLEEDGEGRLRPPATRRRHRSHLRVPRRRCRWGGLGRGEAGERKAAGTRMAADVAVAMVHPDDHHCSLTSVKFQAKSAVRPGPIMASKHQLGSGLYAILTLFF